MTDQEPPPAGGKAPFSPWAAGLIISLGVLTLTGWLFGWAEFDAAPGWSVAGAFVTATIVLILLKIMGSSFIEEGIITVFFLVGFAFFTSLFDYPAITPFLAGIACGALGNLFSGSIHRGAGPDEPAARPLSKAERREQDDEERRRKNDRERRAHESGTASASSGMPAED